MTIQEDGSDKYDVINVQHKYSEASVWMLHDTIYQRIKGSAVFWEKDWGTINSAKYNEHILSSIQALVEAHSELIYMQDNAPSHRSRLTISNLQIRDIRTCK